MKFVRLLLVAALLMLSSVAVQAQNIPHGIDLSWTWTGTGTPTFTLYRATVSGGETLLQANITPGIQTGCIVVGSNTNCWTDSTAVVGTKYYYTVTATVGGVQSNPSTPEAVAQIVLPNSPGNTSTAVH